MADQYALSDRESNVLRVLQRSIGMSILSIGEDSGVGPLFLYGALDHLVELKLVSRYDDGVSIEERGGRTRPLYTLTRLGAEVYEKRFGRKPS